MRQLTKEEVMELLMKISKLPMRQLTEVVDYRYMTKFSKLPMRQLTQVPFIAVRFDFSKLPMRQLTMLEWKKKPTARALIHLFPTLTQIYSCLEIY